MPFSKTVCHVTLLIFLVLWLFEKDLYGKLKTLRTNTQLLALAGLAIILLCGVFYSDNKGLAWFAIEKKLFFLVLPFAIATSSVLSSKFLQNLASLFCASCFTALIICYLAAIQRVQLFHTGEIGMESINYLSSSDFWQPKEGVKDWMFFSYVGLSGGIKMHPTYLAMYSAFCCIVLIQRLFTDDQTRLQQIGTFLLISFFSVSIVFLSSRIILLMLAIAYLGLLGYGLMVKKSKTKPVYILLVLNTLLITGIFINPVTRYRQVDEIVANGLTVSPDKNYDNSTGIRVSLWWVSVQAFLSSNMIFGNGTGDVEQTIKETASQSGITNVLNSYNPHNQYLHILLSSGIVGLTFLLFYLGAGLVKAWQNRDIIFLNFLLLFLAVCLTESVLELQKGIVFFTIFFSCMSFQRLEKNESKTSLNVASVAGRIQ